METEEERGREEERWREEGRGRKEREGGGEGRGRGREEAGEREEQSGSEEREGREREGLDNLAAWLGYVAISLTQMEPQTVQFTIPVPNRASHY